MVTMIYGVRDARLVFDGVEQYFGIWFEDEDEIVSCEISTCLHVSGIVQITFQGL